MTKLSKSRIANTLNIKVYRCEILFIREEILSVGLPPVRFFDVRKRRFGSRFLRFALFLPFFHLFRRFFIPLRPVVEYSIFLCCLKGNPVGIRNSARYCEPCV